jgi:hypothetical protein
MRMRAVLRTGWELPPRPVLIALLVAATAVACAPPSAEELVADIFATRNQFEVRLSSWIDRDPEGPAPYLYLDVAVVKNTEASLNRLTVLVEQLDANNQVLSAQRVPIDVSGLDLRGLSRQFPVEVRPMHPSVEGVRVIVEPNPPRETWSEFPELDRVRPRG